MARWQWFKANGWERAWFKRVPVGWIFQSPISWTFGLWPGRHYLVSDAQKEQIVTVLNPDWRHIDWRHVAGAVAAALVGGAPLVVLVLMAPALGNDPALNLWISVLVTYFWAQCVINVFLWFVLRPTLLAARPTSERITFNERLNATAAIMPTPIAILFGLMLALGFGVSAYEVLIGKWNVGSLIVMLLTGPFAFHLWAMLAVKLTTKRPAG